MFTITVRLFSILRHRDGQIIDKLDLTVAPGTQIGAVMRQLQLPADLDILIALNGEVTGPDATVSQGDLLALIPAISGGCQAGLQGL